MQIKLPKAINKNYGYDPEQVSKMLSEVKDWREIANQELALVENGLEIESTDRVIDAAIDYLQVTEGVEVGEDQIELAKENLAGLLAEKPGGRFPLVGVFEKGFDVKTVDSLLMMAEYEFFGGDQLDTKLLRPGFIPMVRMGYLADEASESLSQIAQALIASRN